MTRPAVYAGGGFIGGPRGRPSVTPAAGPGAPAKLETFVDNFDRAVPLGGRWEWANSRDNNVDMTVAGNRCRFRSPADGATGHATFGFEEPPYYDLRDSYLYCKIEPPPTGGASPPSSVYMELAVYASDYYDNAQIGWYKGYNEDAYYLKLYIGSDGEYVNTNAPYDPVNHLWVRIRDEAGTTHLDTSPDGSTWTSRVDVPTPGWLDQYVIADFQVNFGPIVGAREDCYLSHINVAP